MQAIPVKRDTPAWRQRTSLDGTTFELDFAWNERESAWYLTVRDVEGEPLRGAIRLVIDWPLLRSWADQGRPAGELYFLDLEGTGSAPTFVDMGRRLQLVYVTAADRAELEG
ncbi:MAG: hypothetical protein GWN84_20540 [Gammaproteobacteria bacterium]|nr:hypothetical protein [Gammaproteobacteria bacterium]NIR85150.1 hypothetical protein [Gammaproteobacteria bacterium]NIU06199.1 hypothetical protein [Gammaproteobacteria bacterium]NIX87472.1 hypothetical protein [Gammaproteobacteria bacterium]